jgi:hypothetical protein
MTKKKVLLALSVLALALSFAPTPGASAQSARRQRRHVAASAHRRASKPSQSAQPQEVSYTCPMHRDVHSKTPGECPKCGMELVAEEGGGKATPETKKNGASAPERSRGGNKLTQGDEKQ